MERRNHQGKRDETASGFVGLMERFPDIERGEDKSERHGHDQDGRRSHEPHREREQERERDRYGNRAV
jgi:hypothetical protein